MFTIQSGSMKITPDMVFSLDSGAQFKIKKTQEGFQTTYLLCTEKTSKMVIKPFKHIEECYKLLAKYQKEAKNK